MSWQLRAVGYANTPLAAELPANFGVLSLNNLAALVEQTTADYNLTDWQNLRRYQKAINLWWQSGKNPLLPFQAGANFATLAEIAGYIRANSASFEEKLVKFENKLELGARFPLEPQTQMVATGGGKAYMQKLRQKYAATGNSGLAVEETIKVLAGSALACEYSPGINFVKVAFLLEREQTASFRYALENCGKTAIITGVFPPFSFV
jgi:hypothetical protein